LQPRIEAPTSVELARSPRERVHLLVARIGEEAVAGWCAALLNGTDSYADPRRPAITWLGGRHAAGLLRRGRFEERGQDYWPRVWAARGLLYAWHPGAEGGVLAGLRDRSAWRVREMSAKVARQRGIVTAEPVLSRLLDDPYARVRAAAEAALTESARSRG